MGRKLENFEVEGCTKAAHETNKVYCEAMGDMSHVPWDFVPDEQKAVARQATIGIATLDHTAVQTHEAWVAAKRAQGWQYGEVKDPVKKTHPCIVDWQDLPFEQQVKDELWVSTVKNLLSAFFRIPRQ